MLIVKKSIMKGKLELQFEDNEYYLVDGNTNDTIATTDKVLLKEYNGYIKKLSLKNCQAIENGYDLDDLAENSSELQEGTYTPQHKITYKHGFIDGFQKALKILGDKKFSESDMKKACSVGIDIVNQEGENDFRLFEDLLETLQPTEWDVEIETYIFSTMDDKSGFSERRPKLDSDGCLILKRI